MRVLFSFIILFILCNCINVSLSAVDVTDITPSQQNDKYAYYQSTTSLRCSYDYFLKLERTSGINDFSIVGAIPSFTQMTLLSSSENIKIYKINFNSPVGTTNINIRVLDGVETQVPLTYTCVAPPINNFDVTSYTDTFDFMYTSYYNSEPYILIKVNAFTKSIAPPLVGSIITTSYSFESFTVMGFGSNVYQIKLRLSDTLDWSDIANNISFSLTYPNSNVQVGVLSLASFFNKDNYNDVVVNYDYFPRNPDRSIRGESLIGKVEVSKSDDKPSFFMFVNWGYPFPIYPLPVLKLKTDASTKVEVYITSNALSAFTPTFSQNVKYLLNGVIENQSTSLQYIDPTPPTISSISQSYNYNQSINVVYTDFETTMDLSLSFPGLGTRFASGSAPLYLGEGNSQRYSFEATTFILPFKSTYQINYNAKTSAMSQDIVLQPESIDNIAPQITDINYVVIDHYLVLQMNITDDLSGFLQIHVIGSYQNIVDGTLNNGFYEFIMDLNIDDYSYYPIFILYDRSKNNRLLNTKDFLTPGIAKLPSYHLSLDLITNVRFEFNVLDVTNESKDNTLFIYYPQLYSSWCPQIFVYNTLTKGIDIPIVGKYDSGIGAFKFPIHVHQNHTSGDFFFSIYLEGSPAMFDSPMFKKLFGPQAEFIVQSESGDILGPVVSLIYPIPGPTIAVNIGTGIQANIKWRIFIEDLVNGFRNGIIVIQSSLDYVKYTFEFSFEKDLVQGNEFIGVYEISIPIDGRCKSQEFYIMSVTLFDKHSYTSVYNRGQISFIFDPLFNINLENTTITTECSLSSDLTTPELVSFDFNPKTIDVTYSGELDNVSPRLVTFDFETFDLNGLMIKALPIVYLQDFGSEPISQEATLVNYNETFAKYQCKFEVPFGFGYPDGIRVLLYGIVDNQSNFKGYSSVSLPFSIINVVQTINQNISIISSTELSTSGGDIYITGRQFKSTDTLLIQDSDFNILESINPSLSTNTLMSIKGIGAHNREYIYITLKRNTISQFSNSFKLYLKGYVPPEPNSSSSSSIDTSSVSSSSDNNNLSSDSNIPTNSPQSCLNQCSGNGECTPNGCVCKSPYVGLDCSSQVIIVPPKINNTIPESNFTIPPSSNNKNEVFYAIISVVALNELDNNNNVLNRYSFNQWVVSNNTQSKYQQYTNSTGYIYTASLTNNNDKSITNLSVSIDYFNINEAVNITFANQQLQMNPHSLKYSINITNYSFKSSLSSLQLVLSASIESDNNNDDECSSKQIGDVVNSESEFIKMQIDKTSLYGRFIKRGVIDDRVKYVTNTLLDSEYNAIETTSKSQTYIGINIPFYSKLAQLDPDFSILVDNKPASDNDNAVCGARKSKLTGAQIAGIAIGCAAFAAIIVTSSIYYFYKRNQTNKLNAKIQNKMKNLN